MRPCKKCGHPLHLRTVVCPACEFDHTTPANPTESDSSSPPPHPLERAIEIVVCGIGHPIHALVSTILAITVGTIAWIITGDLLYFFLGATPAAFIGLFLIVVVIICQIAERRNISRK